MQSKSPKAIKPVKAWGVLVSKKQIDAGGQFLPFGNGAQFQYPVFPTKKQALSWWNEDRNTRGLVVPVRISIIKRPKK